MSRQTTALLLVGGAVAVYIFIEYVRPFLAGTELERRRGIVTLGELASERASYAELRERTALV